MDIRTLPAIGIVVETSCRYFAELRFPEVVSAGIGLERLGTSSVVYRLALFAPLSSRPRSAGSCTCTSMPRPAGRSRCRRRSGPCCCR